MLAAALAVRLTMLFIDTPPLRSDSLTYHKLAMSILSGEYARDGYPTAFVVPGYPLFLAGIYSLFGSGETAVRIIQSILDVATAFLFYLICRKIFDKRNAFVALIIFAFFPSNILYTQAILTETLFGFASMLFLLFVYGDVVQKRPFISGLLFSTALLIRTSFLLCIVPVAFYLFRSVGSVPEAAGPKTIAGKALLFAAGALLVMSPWLIRNKITIGEYVLSTQGGSTLWEGSNPRATGTWNKEAADANPLFEEKDELKADREFRKQALQFMSENPAKFIELGFRKIAYLFSSERMAVLYFSETQPGTRSTEVYRRTNPLILALVNIPYFAVILLGLWGMLIPYKKRSLTAGIVLAWIATVFMFVGLPRYHYVLIPFFVIGTVNLLSAGVSSVLGQRAVVKIAGALGSLFLLALWSAEFYLLFMKQD